MKRKNNPKKSTPFKYSELAYFWEKNGWKYASDGFVFKNSFNPLQLNFFFWMTTDWIFEDKLVEKLKIDREQLDFLLNDFDELQDYVYNRRLGLNSEWIQRLPKGKKLYLRLTPDGFRIKEGLFRNNIIPFSVIGYDEKLREWVTKLYSISKNIELIVNNRKKF